MQVSAVVAFLAAVTTVRAEFTAEDQAIWVDRHNYFRTTGLPWSAGDMRRIGWGAELATSAASTAEKCSAVTAAGVNVFQSSSANSSAVIDEAIQQWVVETSMTTLKTLAQPGANGVDVGTGTYNSYSQVLWAATTSVGCATASCPSGQIVVCEYSPAGNVASSPWYVHGDTASDCPSGTTAKTGLCIVEGDAANNQIAPIPAGKLTYEVYPAYVANMQTVLIEAARALANGNSSDSTAQTDPTSTTAPTGTTTPTATKAPTSETSASNGKDDAATKTGTKPTSSSNDDAATKTGTKTTSSNDDAAIKTGTTKKTTTSSSESNSGSGSDSPATKTGKTTDSSEKQTDESGPGTVKASSDTGSKFANQAAQTTTGSSTEQTSNGTPAPATDSTPAPATGSTPAPATGSTPSSANTSEGQTSSAESASSINNKSAAESAGGISPAGMAGMIVLAIVGVAAFGVVMSYKRNQQRQREIMRDGGIRII